MRKRYQISLIVITIALLGAICLATSYALWTVSKTQTGENIVESGCFDITLSDESGLINLENAYPITDEASASLTPYTFKINNTCTIASKYIVNLEVLPTSDLDVQYVSSSIDNGEVVRLKNANSADPTIEGVTVSKTIGSGVVGAGKTKTLAIRLWVDESVTLNDTDAINKTLNTKVSIISSAAPEPESEPTPIIPGITCIRATTLHTEICNQTDTSSYCSASWSVGNGNIITYGNTSTTEGELNTGDAFDCDVDGTGYNHRFYYVTDMVNTSGWNTIDTAVLIYYSNTVVSGDSVIDDASTGINFHSSQIAYSGPVVAKDYIPTTSQWSKVSLINSSRTIKDESGNSYGTINYEDKAGRFLTYSEIVKGCGSSSSNIKGPKCRFLFENTNYEASDKISGYWLETIDSSDWGLGTVRAATGDGLLYAMYKANDTRLGVRPVIEVPKTAILY